MHLLDLVVGQVQLEQLLELSEDGPDCLHIQPIQGQLFDGPKVAEGLEVRYAGLAEVQLDEVLEVKDAVDLLDGVVGQGELVDPGKIVEELHLLDEVLEQAALLQLLQFLYSLEAFKLVAGAADLGQVDQLGEGLEAADAVVVEADDSEVEEALDPFQGSETVVADVEDFEVGEEPQEGKLFDVAEVEVELAEAVGEALHEFGGKLPLDHVHLVGDLPELHADRVALVGCVVPEAVDVDELDELLLEDVLQKELIKLININRLRNYASDKCNSVSMEFREVTDEMDMIEGKFPPELMESFSHRLSKLYLNFGYIEKLAFLGLFPNLKVLYIRNNRLASLEGVECLLNLGVICFDNNSVSSLEPLTELVNLTQVSGTSNQLESLKGI